MLHQGQGQRESGQGDGRSATLPEQLCPLSSVKKLIKSKFMSLHTVTTQFALRVKTSLSVYQIKFQRSATCFSFFNKINAVLRFYTTGRDKRLRKKKKKRIKEKKYSKQSSFHGTANAAAASPVKFIFNAHHKSSGCFPPLPPSHCF